MHIELDSNLLFLNLNDKSLPIFRVYLGVTTWQDFLLKRNKVSFSGSKNLTKSQAFDSVVESLSSDGVGCFVTWFKMVKTTWQNIPVDRRVLISAVAIHCWGLTVNFDGLSNSSLESAIFPCNDQGGREVKSVSPVHEVITHSSCWCSSNVVVLLEPDPKRSSCLTDVILFAIHLRDTEHTSDFSSSLIIARENGTFKRRIREAIEIHCQTPTMNSDNGYELLAIYGDVLSHGFHHPKSCHKTSNTITW